MDKCKCGEELDKDCNGNPRCAVCDPPCPCCNDGGGPVVKPKKKRKRSNRDELMRGLGMVKVKGNLGGTYYE
jgi:hypothetical protein